MGAGAAVGAGLLGCERSAGERAGRLPPGTIPPLADEGASAGGSRGVIERPLPPAVEPTIRVRVAVLRSPERRIRVEGEGPRIVVASRQVKTPADFELTLDGWIVTEAAGSSGAGTFEFPTGPLDVRAEAGGRGLRLGGSLASAALWPDGLRFVPRTDEGIGAADLVCSIELERYLPGVLAKELYNTWSLQTHMAQAIAARSYALCEMAQSRSRHFDVVAGELSQAWLGATTHATSLEATTRTRGIVLLFEDRVVPAYYSSTCGGQPANAVDAISDNPFNSIRPLEVTPASARDCCRSAPAWRWTMSLPTAECARRIAGWAKSERPALAGMDGIRSITVADRNAAGRPVRFTIVDRRGRSYQVPSERLRWAFNADVPGLPAVRSRVRSGDFEPSVSPTSIALAGRGYGHGVGLCQYGAEALSRAGRTWRDILDSYYPASTLQQAYGAGSA